MPTTTGNFPKLLKGTRMSTSKSTRQKPNPAAYSEGGKQKKTAYKRPNLSMAKMKRRKA